MAITIRPNLTHRWPKSLSTLILARREPQCLSLGPGVRAVLWLQGCCFRCPGCVVAEMLPFEGGTPTPIETLAEELIALDVIEGVTFSGGEPFMQAAALVELIDRIKSSRNLSAISYSGFSLPEILAAGEPHQLALLERLDLLIDGRYRRDQHATLTWRGSRNQRVHFLSDRYAHLRNTVDETTVSIDMTIDTDGSFGWAGIPPEGFHRAIETGMAARNVSLTINGGV